VAEPANRAADSGGWFSTGDGRVETYAEKLGGSGSGAHGRKGVAKRLWA
jgi:hypothetical protein